MPRRHVFSRDFAAATTARSARAAMAPWWLTIDVDARSYCAAFSAAKPRSRSALRSSTFSSPICRRSVGPPGDHLVAVLDDPRYAMGFAFGLKGDTGITVLEGEAT